MASQVPNSNAANVKAHRVTATLQLGELISAAFEQACKVTKNQQQAAALASVVVERLLARQGGTLYLKHLAST